MSITTDPTETTAPTSTTAPQAAPPAGEVPEVDLYRDIHKGIRSELFGTTVQAGSTDPSDRDARLELGARVEGLVAMLRQHAEHEDAGVQPAIEVHLPATAERIADDHERLDARIADIHEIAVVAADACGPAARTLGQELYLELASFTGSYLQHQDLEERVVMPALAAALGPLGVLQIHQGIIGSIPPAELATSLAVMLPAMNVDDRTEMLGGIRMGAPDEVFAGIWGLAGSVLAPVDLAAVGVRLGIA